MMQSAGDDRLFRFWYFSRGCKWQVVQILILQQRMQVTGCSDFDSSAGDASDSLFRFTDSSAGNTSDEMQITGCSDFDSSACNTNDRLFRFWELNREYKWQIIQISIAQQGMQGTDSPDTHSKPFFFSCRLQITKKNLLDKGDHWIHHLYQLYMPTF